MKKILLQFLSECVLPVVPSKRFLVFGLTFRPLTCLSCLLCVASGCVPGSSSCR